MKTVAIPQQLLIDLHLAPVTRLVCIEPDYTNWFGRHQGKSYYTCSWQYVCVRTATKVM